MGSVAGFFSVRLIVLKNILREPEPLPPSRSLIPRADRGNKEVEGRETMIGITSYGAYVPLHRLGPETKGWGFPIEKAVGHYDEDSLTMAVAAALDCIGGNGRDAVDGLYFASTTAPYKEKLTAATVAIACDLSCNSLTADFANSLRAGTSAIRTGIDALKAGSAKSLLVAASDCGRLGQPRDSFDQNVGDGAAAFLLGTTEIVAAIEASDTVSNELTDIWRIDGGKYLRSWEDRFTVDEGYLKVVPEAIAAFLKKQKMAAKDITKAVYNAPDRRRHADLAKKLGLAPQQVQDPQFGKMGNTGAAFAPMLLVAALEDANPGDSILVANYGNGVDISLLKVTDDIIKMRGRRGIKRNLAQKMTIPDYETYLGIRHSLPESTLYPPGRPSASATYRDRDAIYRLHGGQCRACGTIQYPPQRICTRCRAKDSWESVRLSDRRARIFTYTLDNLAQVPSCDLPMVDCIINFEGGGRGCFQMTDRDPREVKVGLEVEMTFRKLHTAFEMNNYFWKCTPVREAVQAKES
jgi:3-hydroxy-3-methylglutaryl CoA synthase